jgi:hypothetical protein
MNNFSIINNINYNKINNNHLLLIKENNFNLKISEDIFYKIENNQLKIKISNNFRNKFSNIYLYKIEFNNINFGNTIIGYKNTNDGIILDSKNININNIINLSNNWKIISNNFNSNIIIKNLFWISSKLDDISQNLSIKNIYEINSLNNIIIKISTEFKIDKKIKINNKNYLPLKVLLEKNYKLIGLNINLPNNIFINLDFNSANQYVIDNQIYETWVKKYTINNLEDNNFNAYSTINKGLIGNDNWQTILYLSEYQNTEDNYILDSYQLKDIKYNISSLNDHFNILISQYNIKKNLITNNCNEILNYINNSVGISSNIIINENDILTKVMKMIVFLINTIKINDNNVLLPLLNTIINGEVTYNNGIYYVNGRQVTINDTHIITDSNIYTNNLNSILNNWNTNSLDDLNLLVSNWNT